MSIFIASLGPKRKMIGLFQKINIMNNSRTGDYLYIMVRRRERQRKHALSMQALPSLMEFLGK